MLLLRRCKGEQGTPATHLRAPPYHHRCHGLTPRRTRGSKEEDRPARRGISRPPTFVSSGRSAVAAAAARRRRRGSVAAGGAPAGTETVRAAPVQPAALPCDGTGRGGGASNWLRSSHWTPAAQVEQAPPWRSNLEHDGASRGAGRRGGGLGGQGARGWRRRGSELLALLHVATAAG